MHDAWNHLMTCPYPEGCNCGASGYNELRGKYIAMKDTIEKQEEKIEELRQRTEQHKLPFMIVLEALILGLEVKLDDVYYKYEEEELHWRYENSVKITFKENGNIEHEKVWFVCTAPIGFLIKKSKCLSNNELTTLVADIVLNKLRKNKQRR